MANYQYPWKSDSCREVMCPWHRMCFNDKKRINKITIVTKPEPCLIISDKPNIQYCNFKLKAVIEKGIFYNKHYMIINNWRHIPRDYGCDCNILIYDDTYDSPMFAEVNKILPIVNSLGCHI